LIGASAAGALGGFPTRFLGRKREPVGFPATNRRETVGDAAAIAIEPPWWLRVSASVMLTNALTVMLTSIGGDIMSQSVEGSHYSLTRTLRFTLFRVLAGFPIYVAWLAALERFNRHVPRRAQPAVKTAIDCMIYTPIYQAFFFSVMGLFEGRTIAESVGRCVRMLPATVPASWKFWAPVQLVTFGLCPIEWRVAWVNVVSLVWNAVMSSFNAGAA